MTQGDPWRWPVPLFRGIIREGRLYRRGGADMKWGVAAATKALRAFRDARVGLRGRAPRDRRGRGRQIFAAAASYRLGGSS
ncbi:MAG TPA: M20/M25/M40 family metallo-hydrolase [bacterium]|nr:M20/M25/M40 family metallo-hydrolase [bacterium]